MNKILLQLKRFFQPVEHIVEIGSYLHYFIAFYIAFSNFYPQFKIVFRDVTHLQTKCNKRTSGNENIIKSKQACDNNARCRYNKYY